MLSESYSQDINVLPPHFGGRRFYAYSTHFKKLFGARMQKVAINAALSCPNRDGTKGEGGCTFCINEAFTPSYCTPSKSIAQQIGEGIEFHERRYRTAGGYLAYLQPFSNTYAPVAQLEKIYAEALAHPQIKGLIIGTRPDCVDEAKLDLIADIAKDHYISIEYGVESTFDETLHRINRGHSYAEAERAIALSAERGLSVGAHFILGLPGESVEMLHKTINRINNLPLTTVKFHQLQIFRGTAMQREYDTHPERFSFWEADEYIELFIDLIEELSPKIVVERFASEAPPRYHHVGAWGLVRNETLLARFERRLAERNTYQGRRFAQ
ncbi:MAG: TIGR01212 family radical SAM protein [Rikenellaceae bacterium]